MIPVPSIFALLFHFIGTGRQIPLPDIILLLPPLDLQHCCLPWPCHSLGLEEQVPTLLGPQREGVVMPRASGDTATAQLVCTGKEGRGRGSGAATPSPGACSRSGWAPWAAQQLCREVPKLHRAKLHLVIPLILQNYYGASSRVCDTHMFNSFYSFCFDICSMCFCKTKIYWNLEFYDFKVCLSPDCEFLLLEEEGKV